MTSISERVIANLVIANFRLKKEFKDLMIQKFKNSRLKIVSGIFFCVIVVFCFLMNGCVENANGRMINVNKNSACQVGVRLAKEEIKKGKYSVYVPNLSKELSPYAEEVFYVLYKKDVDVKNDDFLMCGTMSENARLERNCHNDYMDSVVQSFESGLFKRIRNDAESLWRKYPDRYNSEHPDQPQFPGGDSAFRTFLKNTIKYPASAKRDSAQGTVFVRLEIDSTGKVVDRIVVKGIRRDLDSAALAGMNNLPDFKPVFSRGHAIASSIVKPVKFILE